MPVPSHPIKVVCRSCGWHLIVTNHLSDVVTAWDLSRDALFNRVPHCGRCGGKDLVRETPGLLEAVNPVEYGRKLVYMAGRWLHQ